MDEKVENKINNIGAKIDIIESVNNALRAALLGEDCLTHKDAYNIAYILENRMKDLKCRHNKLIDDLKI